jgi:hypothetical protein
LPVGSGFHEISRERTFAEHAAQVRHHRLRIAPVRVDRADRLHHVLEDRWASQQRARPVRFAVPQNAMPPAQIPELREILVGPKHPSHSVPDELAIRLADLPSWDSDTDRIRLVRPADGDAVRTGFGQSDRPSQVIAVLGEWVQISPTVGPSREAGAMAKANGDWRVGHDGIRKPAARPLEIAIARTYPERPLPQLGTKCPTPRPRSCKILDKTLDFV